MHLSFASFGDPRPQTPRGQNENRSRDGPKKAVSLRNREPTLIGETRVV